jgi:hypothetical protein
MGKVYLLSMNGYEDLKIAEPSAGGDTDPTSAAPQYAPSFTFGATAPDPMSDVVLQRVLQTVM